MALTAEQLEHLMPEAGARSPAVSITAAAHDAAALDDRTMASWVPVPGSADADLLTDLEIMTPRSRDLIRNNGLAGGAVQTQLDNILGSVLRLMAKPDWRMLGRDQEWAREWVANVESLFREWSETTECDAARKSTLLGLTTQALRGDFMNGDAVGIPRWQPRVYSRWATRVQVIESDRLATPSSLLGDPSLRGGVEVDRYGAPVAYHIRKTHPGDIYGLRMFSTLAAVEDFERIPAHTPWGRRRVVHLHDPERSGQSRGKPLMASVMKEFRMLGHYGKTELQAAVANSLVAMIIESNLDQDSIGDLFGANPETYWRDQIREYQVQLKGGASLAVPVGASVKPFVPGRPNTAFDPFMTAFLRFVAAGLNMPYELVAKDFSKVNYSSARAALLEAWRYFLGRRRWVVEYWLQPIYELWLEEAINRGLVEAPDFYDNRYAYCRSTWVFAGRGWVDPQKEAMGAKLRMEIGISTEESECAEQGKDWEEVLEQRARELVRRREVETQYGLPEGALDPTPSERLGSVPTENEETETEEEAA